MRAERALRLDLKLAATVALAFLILVSLGVWQVLRLQEKTALLHKIDLLQAAPARPLSEVLGRGGDADFTRVEIVCAKLEQSPALKTYALSEAGPVGDRILTSCPIAIGPYQSILVDRGFAPKGAAVAPSTAPLTGAVVGVLRKPPKASLFMPKPAELNGEWSGRDLPAMAVELKALRPVPYFLELEKPVPAAGYPKPEPLSLGISNNHLGYAITWFGLAAALIGVYIGYLRRKV